MVESVIEISKIETGLTVTIVDVENIPACAVTEVVPAESAEKIPLLISIVPTERSELSQVVVVAKSSPYWSVVDAIRVVVAPTESDGDKVKILIAASAGGANVTITVLVVVALFADESVAV